MSQWSRRRAGSFPQRTLSLPIFFNGISEEDQEQEIKSALKNVSMCLITGTRTINLSFLALKKIPISGIISSLKEVESFNPDEEIDYEKLFMQQESPVLLNLEGNMIETVPGDICVLEKIKGLFLRSNKISTLPHKICFMSMLTTLTLANNPIKYLPIEITKLSITQFTISSDHFYTAGEIDEINKRGSTFSFHTLEEICLKGTEKIPLHNLQLRQKYSLCSICNSYTASTQETYRILLYKEMSIPFSFLVCSEKCRVASLETESVSAQPGNAY